MKRQNEMNLTDGNLFLKIPLFALPMALSTILQLLYSSVDLATVSHFGGGSISMSAVSSNSALINLIITLFVSLAVGSNVAMGNAKGSGNKDRAQKILSSSMIISVIAGLIVAVFGYFLSPYLLKVMGTNDDLLPLATQYLEIYFLGIPFLIIYNFGAQVLRALGDSNRPFYFLAISGVINVVFDLLFVIVFDLDVVGVAWATVIAEIVCAVLTVAWLFINKKGYVYLTFKDLKLDKQSVKEILRIGIPAGLQGLGFCIPNVLIQSSLYTIHNYTINGILISDNEIVAGAGASSQIESYVYALIDAIALSCISFVGQNYGAMKKENIKKIYWYSMIWMMIGWAVCALLVLCIPNQILSVFITDGKESEFSKESALLAGKERMFMMVFTYAFDGFMDVSSQYLRGLKYSTAPAIITLVGCTGSRILFILVLFTNVEYFHTIFWLYFCYPLSWILVDLIYIPVTIVLQKKVFKNIDAAVEARKIAA